MQLLNPSTDPLEDLQREGELSLARGDFSQAAQHFAEASKLAPESATLLLRQGLAYFEYGSSKQGREKTLQVACKRFKAALRLAPSLIEAWHAWGNALFFLGASMQESRYFQEAQEKLQKALELAPKDYELACDLYWDYASCWLQISQYSDEACDLHAALKAFTQASTLSETLSAEFWNDFGCAYLSLAERINDIHLHIKAISCFKNAANDGCRNLAHALGLMYAKTHQEEHFQEADSYFAQATKLEPHDSEIWLAWARFLLEAAKTQEEEKHLKACIEKCTHAHAIDPKLAPALALWADALALLGEYSERLDLLDAAETKANQALELDNSPEILYAHGNCLAALGRYFDDHEYFYEAIETYQRGLSADRTCSFLWEAIGEIYVALGDIEEEGAYQKSLRFYQKAQDLAPSSSLYFQYALALSKLGEEQEDETILEDALTHFEKALLMQKNALYMHADWLFQYAYTLDLVGNFHEEEQYYRRAIEIFSHVLMLDPDFPDVHHRLSIAFQHLGELSGEVDFFYKALHHARIAIKHEPDCDQILIDLSLVLSHLAERAQDASERENLVREAEHKLTQAARLGNENAYYHLSCLYSLLGQYDQSLRLFKKAEVAKTLPSLDQIIEEEWLEGLRATSEFREYFTKLERKY